MNHVAVLHEPYIRAILDGSKTVESRLSKMRCAPFGAVSPGDVIYFKLSGGPFALHAVAHEIESHDDLSPGAIDQLRKRLNRHVGAPREYWRAKRDARCATFIWLREVRPIERGPIIPALNGRGWLVLPRTFSMQPHRPAHAHGIGRDLIEAA